MRQNMPTVARMERMIMMIKPRFCSAGEGGEADMVRWKKLGFMWNDCFLVDESRLRSAFEVRDEKNVQEKEIFRKTV